MIQLEDFLCLLLMIPESALLVLVLSSIVCLPLVSSPLHYYYYSLPLLLDSTWVCFPRTDLFWILVCRCYYYHRRRRRCLCPTLDFQETVEHLPELPVDDIAGMDQKSMDWMWCKKRTDRRYLQFTNAKDRERKHTKRERSVGKHRLLRLMPKTKRVRTYTIYLYRKACHVGVHTFMNRFHTNVLGCSSVIATKHH